MDHIKRADRLGAITRILTATPNRLHGYAEFCELFGAAKSTISEDIDIIANSISRFAEGRVCLLYTSPSPRDETSSRMPSSA